MNTPQAAGTTTKTTTIGTKASGILTAELTDEIGRVLTIYEQFHDASIADAFR